MDEKIVLIDLEQQENAAAIGLIGRDLILRPAGKETIPLAPPGTRLAASLAEAGLYPCDDRNLSDFPFYPVPSLALFGEDERGTVYGFVGGCSEESPIGYVTVKGETGTAAGDILEFVLMLETPGWQDRILSQKTPAGFVIYPSRFDAEDDWTFADGLVP